MPVSCLIKPGEYHDSVSLMSVAQELSRLPGVKDAAVVMATEANKAILKEAGLFTKEIANASPNDLVITVNAIGEAVDRALEEADTLLKRRVHVSENSLPRPKTLRGASKANPSANVAVISVSGRYAADEAWEALHQNLHVLLFSDNVSLEDEIALKQYASQNGLLLMGPGAGTAILNGVALGFANVLPAGPVGIISAAGTGLQEVSTLLAKRGIGITQGIGTGGRDLRAEVGGSMMICGVRSLQDDPHTQVIVLISKPPDPKVAQRILDQAGMSLKPTVVCFLGEKLPSPAQNVLPASTLEEAANLAAEQVNPGSKVKAIKNETEMRLPQAAAHLTTSQRYLRGLFSGGTLCYEAQVIWRDLINEPIFSNTPLDAQYLLPDPTHSKGHTIIDLGEEEFTVGRLHPMIDNSLRIRRLLQEANDPETAVIHLDVVLGYGAHPNPAGELGAAIRKARLQAVEAGRDLIVVAAVTGTENDPQVLSRQQEELKGAGAMVCESNAAAARFTAEIIRNLSIVH